MDGRDRLYKNARDAIDMGITDYATGAPTRAASGVRNFYSGILLLAKYVLAAKVPAADLMADKQAAKPCRYRLRMLRRLARSVAACMVVLGMGLVSVGRTCQGLVLEGVLSC